MEIQDIVNDILNKAGVFYKEDGNMLEAGYDPLIWEGPMHSKAISRIYIEKMEENGGSFVKIIGAVTEPIKKHEVMDMTLAEEYLDKKERKYQIWINDEDIDHVKVVIPKGFRASKKTELPTLKVKKKMLKTTETYMPL